MILWIMLEKVKKAIIDHGLIERGDTVLVAFSGGADSTALLTALFLIKDELGFSVAAAHFNHSIRLDADADEDFCREFCKERDIPFYSEKGDAPHYAEVFGLSLETAARKLRFDFLMRIMDKTGAASVATAHHADDDAESVLMHIIRGSGLAGLTGIKPKSTRKVDPKTQGEITLIRPLIDIKKAEILDFLNKNALEYREDSTNYEADAARNILRLKVLPLIRESVNPAFDDNLLRLKRIAAEDEEYLELTAKAALETARTEDGYIRAKLNELPRAILKRCLRLILSERASLVDIEEKHIESLIALIKMQSGASVDLPRVRARNVFEKLTIETGTRDEAAEGTVLAVIESPCGRIETAAGCFVLSVFDKSDMEKSDEKVYNYNVCAGGTIALMDFEALTFPLTVRTRLPGDRFRPVNSEWRMHLKDYFISKKTDRCIRSAIPLVISDGEIVFIPGFVIADGVKITEKTAKILKIEYIKKNDGGK